MGDLTAHFSRSELDCKHCGAGTVTPQLLAILESLRAQVGRPLTPVSGFRCKPHNDAVGGAGASRHVEGDACDLPEGYATVDQAVKAGAVGIGSRGKWALHVDWRPGGPARWTYP